MKNVKELFEKARTKVAESKIATSTSSVLSKVKNSKIVKSVKTKMANIKTGFKEFVKAHHGAVDSMTGNVNERFSSKFKKLFKKKVKDVQDKANNGNIFAKFFKAIIKILSTIALLTFGTLVLYCIKDVFLGCIMLVATCAAVTISIEFILSVLSVATGSAI